MSENKYSLEAFSRFINYLGEKHLVNIKTVSNWKQALLKFNVLIIDDKKEVDLREVDIDGLLERFKHKYSNELTPSSMAVYCSRIKSAIKNFFKYVENPSGFRPSTAKKTGSRLKDEKKKKEEKFNELDEKKKNEDISGSMRHSDIPIPLRNDLTILVRSVPFDLSVKEAKKIAAIIQGYASAEEQF